MHAMGAVTAGGVPGVGSAGWVPGRAVYRVLTQPARLRLFYGILRLNRFILPFDWLIEAYLMNSGSGPGSGPGSGHLDPGSGPGS